jgi:site-specific recombinase XerD
VNRALEPGPELAGKWISRFLTSHLPGERGLAARTIDSYRETIKLFLRWNRDMLGVPPDKLRLTDIDRGRVTAFLDWLESGRGNSPATRNQRLAAIKTFVRYTAAERPEHLEQATQILAIKQKKTPRPDLGRLTPGEVETLLAEPDPATRRGLRDMTLLCVLYDSAARVQEACDLNAADVRQDRPMVLTLTGKGSKTRHVPLMDATADLVRVYLGHRPAHGGVGADADPLFPGPGHTRLTRSGVTKILARHVQAIRAREPGWAPGLSVTPHVIRRTRAVHLLQAGVNLVYIRDLLGHADISTTEVYARADTETKRQAIENAYQALTPTVLPDWTTDSPLLEWIDNMSR